MDNTTKFSRLLKGLRPGGHLLCDPDRSTYLVRCTKCLAEDMARRPIADQLRCYTDGWGVVDLDLVMTDLAMQIAAGSAPNFLTPEEKP